MATANVKQTFFTDEKLFYVSPPVNSQNNRVWSAGLKRNINPERLLLERAKFSASVMVSAGVCYGGKGKLHFVDEKAKINVDYYVTKLLPKLFEDCEQLLPAGFIFQQDGAPAPHHIKLRIGLSHTILPSFQRISGHPIRQILILLTITYGELCWTSTKS